MMKSKSLYDIDLYHTMLICISYWSVLYDSDPYYTASICFYLPELLVLLQSDHLRWISDLDFVVVTSADSGLGNLNRPLQIGPPYTVHDPKHRDTEFSFCDQNVSTEKHNWSKSMALYQAIACVHQNKHFWVKMHQHKITYTGRKKYNEYSRTTYHYFIHWVITYFV